MINKKRKKQKAIWYQNYAVTIEGRAAILFNRARERTKKLNLDFNLDKKWIIKHLKKGRCEVTGLKFTYENPRKGHQFNPYSPSLDRHDNRYGYTKKNTKVVVTAYNLAKNTWNRKHFRRIIKAIYMGMFK